MDQSAVLISLKTASISIVFTFFLGIFSAWQVGSLRSPALKTLLDGLFTLPLVLPPTVAGFFLLYIFGVKRPVGAFLLDFLHVKIVFTWGATVLAAVVISFPLMYRSARGAFDQLDQTLLDAARTLGRSDSWVFWRVALPLARPGIAAGSILSFARGLGEFGTTAMIAGNIAGQTRTLPLAVYSAVAGGNPESASGYVGILMGISFLALTGLNLFSGPPLHNSPKRRKKPKGQTKRQKR